MEGAPSGPPLAPRNASPLWVLALAVVGAIALTIPAPRLPCDASDACGGPVWPDAAPGVILLSLALWTALLVPWAQIRLRWALVGAASLGFSLSGYGALEAGWTNPQFLAGVFPVLVAATWCLGRTLRLVVRPPRRWTWTGRPVRRRTHRPAH